MKTNNKFTGNWPLPCAGCGQNLFGLNWFLLGWTKNAYAMKLEPFYPRCTKEYAVLLRGPWKRYNGKTLELIDSQLN